MLQLIAEKITEAWGQTAICKYHHVREDLFSGSSSGIQCNIQRSVVQIIFCAF